MRQCVMRSRSLLWIKIRQPSNKVLEIRLNISPQRERSARILRTEATSNNLEYVNPRAIAKMLQESVETFLVCKIGDLVLKNDGE